MGVKSSKKKKDLTACCGFLVTQSCLTICNSTDWSKPDLPVHHHLLELPQTHVHWVNDAILISSSVVPFSSCPQSFPASGSYPMNWLFASGGQGIGASASVLPMNIQGWFPLELTGWVSLQSKGLTRVFSNTTVHHFFMVQLSHPYMTTEKEIALTIRTFVTKVMSLLFNMLSRLVIVFLPRSKRLLLSWLQSPSAMILEPKKIVSHCFHCFPIYLTWSDETGCHDLHLLNGEF